MNAALNVRENANIVLDLDSAPYESFKKPGGHECSEMET